jgi:hypothetical protein
LCAAPEAFYGRGEEGNKSGEGGSGSSGGGIESKRPASEGGPYEERKRQRPRLKTGIWGTRRVAVEKSRSLTDVGSRSEMFQLRSWSDCGAARFGMTVD